MTKAKKPAGVKFRINKHDRMFPAKGVPGGIMRAEAGDYIVTDANGNVSIKPPSVFRLEHPELVK